MTIVISTQPPTAATVVGDYDLPSRFIASDSFLAGTIRRVGGSWVFWDMTAGKSFPLSFDHYYFP
jgi:hypothetical protein